MVSLFFSLIVAGVDIQTHEVDKLLAETAAYLNMVHPDNGKLASRISVTALHKVTNEKFTDTVE